jgi:hypothetical protein
MTDDPFVTHRSLLFTVAYEMLGSAADAEDVVQGDLAAVGRRRPRRGAGPRGPTWSGSSPGRRSTGCGRWRGVARSTSGSGCPSSRFKTVAPDAVVGAVWLNGAPAGRTDLAGELDTAVSLVVADGRISPHLRDPQPAQACPAGRGGHT